MIPTPKLDDRTFRDIVEEAIRLIPQYCPEWTNYNPSDPGVTLIELFAWMTEMILYRLNRVPDKNYLAFLNLLGIKLRPPQPAKAILTFQMSEKGDHTLVPARTTVGTKPNAEGKVVSFETDRDLVVVRNRIKKCFSQCGRRFEDHTRKLLEGESDGFHPFAGTMVAERCIYLGDECLRGLGEGASLWVRFKCPHPNTQELLDHLEWEVFDGERWTSLLPIDVESDAERVVLPPAKKVAKTVVNDVTSYFVRCRLVDVPSSPGVTVVDTIRGGTKVTTEGVSLDAAFVHTAEDIYASVDPGKRFYLFGKEPKVQTELYIRCDQAFQNTEAFIRLDIELEGGEHDKPNASEDLEIVWEYYDQKRKRWRRLGRVKPGEELVEGPEGTSFMDTSLGFTRRGQVSFVVPSDLGPVEASGNEGLYVRCRIEKGDYGRPGIYELDGDKWVFKDDRPLRPPVVSGLTVRYEQKEHPFQYVITENDGIFADHSDTARTDVKSFQALAPVSEASPALYIGFEDSFPNEEIQLYFHVKEESSVHDPLSVGHESKGPVVAFEYFNGKEFVNLFPEDETNGFLHSGFVRFVGPTDFRRSKRFGENLYYLRARLEMGGYVEPPRIQTILLNSVSAHNVTTHGETILGSSQGTPNQVFKLPMERILPGQKLVVLEREEPSQDELAVIMEEEGEDAVTHDPAAGGWWVTWHEVEDLYESRPDSRHYVKDIVAREVRFGDGIHGKVPPKGDRNVRLKQFKAGGGMDGNVPAGSLTVLNQSITFIERVTNLFPASGGADMETVEEVKARAPHVFRSRFRAVTAEDFEWVARSASTSVARAKCIPCVPKEGHVTVAIVPKTVSGTDEGGGFVRPIPSTELLRRVREVLEAHKLVSTIVHVVRPRYRDLKIRVSVIRHPAGSSDAVKGAIVNSVREFLDPLKGGKNRRGWPFGRPVSKVDIFQVCETVPGVDFVDKVAIVDLERYAEVDHVRLDDDELPFVVDVEIAERAHERIL